MNRVVIALGGNALLRKNDRQDFVTQVRRAKEALSSIADVINDHQVVITHGNGPQVGNILLQNEIAREQVVPMPLDVCGAMSQGLISQAIFQAYESIRVSTGIDKDAVSIFTRTLVSADDEAFDNPSKPIGPFYTDNKARKLREQFGWPLVQITGKGWRRVVPSPTPIEILEAGVIKSLLADNYLPIGVGGGGVPVIKTESGYRGVEAVIDKDLASAVLATNVGADSLMILTDVDHVYKSFGTDDEEAIGKISLGEMKSILKNNRFENGSILPKIRAALNFVENGGKRAYITSLEYGKRAMEEDYGTVIYSD